MSKKASPTVIGFFTLVGLIIAGAAAVLFGAGKYFENTYPILLYFDKSANGLQVGSDVRFGGVRIGSVSSITVLVDPEENRKIIPVIVELGEKNLRAISSDTGGGIDFSSREGVEEAVRDGLRAGMKQQSLVTGQLYIEFDILPKAEAFIYQPREESKYPVVPTVSTQMDELVAGIAAGLEKFNELDLDAVMVELRDVLNATKEQITALDVAKINDNFIAITEDVRVISEDVRAITSDDALAGAVDNLNKALVSIDELATQANVGLEPLLADLKVIMKRTESSLESVEAATRDMSEVSNPRAPAVMQLQNVLRETQRASQALQELSNDLKRNPNTLLRGRAPSE